MIILKSVFSALIQISLISYVFAGEIQPKYGPEGAPKAIPLAQSNEYFRDSRHPAPAFWSLISFYIPQTKGGSCGSATLAMVLNAARARQTKSASESVITEETLWQRVDSTLWKSKLNEGRYRGQYGLDLNQMGKLARAAFQIFGFQKVAVQVIHIDKSSTQNSIQLVKDLKSLSQTVFILANFNQKIFTDDADVGHFAPVGAYDEERRRILILDPDRGAGELKGYYEPYWVSLEDFEKGMATQDSSNAQNRGYILVRAEGDSSR